MPRALPFGELASAPCLIKQGQQGFQTERAGSIVKRGIAASNPRFDVGPSIHEHIDHFHLIVQCGKMKGCLVAPRSIAALKMSTCPSRTAKCITDHVWFAAFKVDVRAGRAFKVDVGPGSQES